MKRPAFQFYPGDWQRDAALRACSVGARGMWIEMMCVMHQADPYGYLVLNSNPIEAAQLARMVGSSEKEAARWMAELQSSGVFSVDDSRRIFSRRMVRDEELREKRGAGGKLGGNPDLGVNYNIPGYVYVMSRADGQVKIGISVSPEKRAYKIRKAIGDETVSVIAKGMVQDMGAEESKLHAAYADFNSGGEWFILPDHDREGLVHLVNTLKVNGKANPTPSSSVFSLPTSTSKTSRAKPRVPIPENFSISENVRAWAADKGHSDLERRLEHFKGYAKANGKVYSDWDHGFMNAIRDDWAKLSNGATDWAAAVAHLPGD